MEPSGCPSESVSSGRLAVAMPSAATDAAEPVDVWIRLEQKLRTLAASEHARQSRSSSLNCESKEVVGKFALRLVQRIVEILRQATENLPETAQRVADRAAIDRLFALDRPREYAGKPRTQA